MTDAERTAGDVVELGDAVDTPESAPIARREPVSRMIHGVELVDEYAWLAERGSAEALAYLESENRYAEARLRSSLPLRDALYREFVGRIRETDMTVPARLDDHLYYARTEEGLQYRIYCRRRDAPGAVEEVIVDLNRLAEGTDYVGVGGIEISPDHNLLAFSLDSTGSESYELVVRNLETGEFLKDRVEGIGAAICWANDNRTIFYTTLDAARRPYRVLRHELGAREPDPEVYREDDEAFFVSVERTRSRRYVLITSGSNVTTETHYIPADEPQAAPSVIEPRSQGVEYFVDHRGGSFFIRTNRAAQNFRLLERPIGGTGADEMETLGHRPDTKLESVELFAEQMVIVERREGLQRLRVRSYDGVRDDYVSLPESAYTLRGESNPEFSTAVYRFAYTSLVTPLTVFDYDVETGELETRKVQEVKGGYDKSLYTTSRIEAPAPDGVAVPISLVHRRDVALDGSCPCLLSGYGAYGMILQPAFSEANVSLLERGFVVATAHVRGGGLLGEGWHEEGRMLAKRNSFTDFIAAAEHLIETGYTSSARLAIRGGSAGGLLVGAVLNMRPELFGAAVAQVPFVDVMNTMLDRSIPLTVIEFEEWGNPEKRDYFDYMLSYSPYDNVGASDYPAMLVTAGLNDPRVQYWEPAKWVARLRARKTDSNPLLLRTYMGAGHVGPSGRYELLRERALEYAFLIETLGAAASPEQC